MRIAQVAPLWETVPPKTYGGTELMVHWLSEALVARGHQVTLFAAKGSEPLPPGGTLHTSGNGPLRGSHSQMPVMLELKALEEVFARADEFDIIHNHVGHLALPFASLVDTPVLTTLHCSFQQKPLRDAYQLFAEQPFVYISNYQRAMMPSLNYAGTIYHGLPLEDYPLGLTPEPFLLFVGRISKEKGPHHAIEIAQRTGYPLVLAAKVDPVDKEYFREEIEPHLDGERIRWVGEVNLAQKVALFQRAMVTLCPVTWPEPFGLVFIESLACGTPVLALKNGSVPEVLRNGVTGFIGESVDELVAALKDIPRISRQGCRAYVEQRFTSAQMAQNYLKTYRRLVEEPRKKPYHTAGYRAAVAG
jgi:glycosyltransferase involved in cell wall biosynthesis